MLTVIWDTLVSIHQVATDAAFDEYGGVWLVTLKKLADLNDRARSRMICFLGPEKFSDMCGGSIELAPLYDSMTSDMRYCIKKHETEADP